MTHVLHDGATRRRRSAIFLMAAALGITGSASGALAFGSSTSKYVVTVDDTETLSGQGQSVTVSTRNLWVGNNGTGVLTISNGAKVSGHQYGYLAVNRGTNGTVTVDGVGSELTSSDNTIVGYGGTGTLTISNGGKVSAVGGGIAAYVNSTGTATVDGAGSTWANSGTFSVGNGGAGTLAISNGGKVSNTSGGIGDAVGSTGTVTVKDKDSTWVNSGSLTVGYEGKGTLTISNGGTVSAGGGTGTVTLASQRGSTGTLNIGGAAGAAPAAAGTLNAATVAFGSGSGTINFNHTNTSSTGYTFASALSGNGTLNQIAGNTSLTGNSSGFTGATNVTGGRLAANGLLDHSAVTVSNDGILGGTGTVGSFVANRGGIVAPGNSIGTLKVAGNVSFNSGSTYQVQVQADGASDRITATGTATITGATLQIESLAGNYRPTTSYTILSANSVTGTFSTVTNNLAFLDASLSYDPKNIYLRLTRNDVTIGSVARTPNQRATGSVIKVGRTPDAIYNGILSQTADGARHALDQLSGGVYASAKTALIEDSRFVREAVNDRLRAAFSDVGAASMPGMSYGQNGEDLDLATEAWGQAFGAWSSYGSDVNASRMQQSTGGFVTGIDTGNIENWRVGLVGGYSRSSFNMKDSASSGESDNYHLGVYGGTRWGALALRSGLAYTWSNLDTVRTVDFSGFRDGLKANYDAGALQAFGELGYRLDTQAASFEPFVNLAHVSLHTDGFTEKGGAAALGGESQTTDTTFTTLGLRTSTDFMLGSVRAAANGTVGWRHAFGDTSPYSRQGFVDSSLLFTIAGVPIANDTFVLQTGLDMKVTDNATLGISYNGEFGSGSMTNRVDARLGIRF